MMPTSAGTKVDFDGFREKVLRLTRSQSTVDVYLRGVAKLAQFGRARLGLEGDDRQVLQEMIDGLSGRDWRDDAVYPLVDRFVGWALSLDDAPREPLSESQG
jgi:hypothetical protein